jgi:transcription initiation factor TFIIIB Brf1 subunit/transcription initiation factor TFIIB
MFFYIVYRMAHLMEYFSVFEDVATNTSQQTKHLTREVGTENGAAIDGTNKKNKIIPLNKCCHSESIIEGITRICTDCGAEIEKVQTFEREWRCYDTDSKRNPARCIARKSEAMIIFKDLENMGIGENIISVANEIYVQVTKGQIKRGKSSRKAIIAACLFHAYKRLGLPKSCDSLREMFKDAKLDKSDFLHGFKHVALNMDKSTGMHTTYITPQDIIYELMGILNATPQQREEAIKFFEELEPHSRVFKESRPQSVAAGIVFHYINLRAHATMTIKEFAAKVKISELTISKIRSEIVRIQASQ